MESEHHPYAMTITMLVLICVIVTLIRPIQVHFTLHQRRIAFTVSSVVYICIYITHPSQLDYALTPVLAVLVLLLSTAMTPSQVARGMLGRCTRYRASALTLTTGAARGRQAAALRDHHSVLLTRLHVHCPRCHGPLRLPRTPHRAGHARLRYGTALPVT